MIPGDPSIGVIAKKNLRQLVLSQVTYWILV